MNIQTNRLKHYIDAIKKSGLSIYDPVLIGDPELWIPTPDLETILNLELIGISLSDLPLRTRSKIVKEQVCKALGYPIPASFKKTQPRFPGQLFDTYIQKSNNLQIWNEEISPKRRYVIIQVSGDDLIKKIRVVTGENLAILDTTGTLTQKYQARLVTGISESELIIDQDTSLVSPLVGPTVDLRKSTPISNPTPGNLLPIGIIFNQLKKLIGVKFPDSGYDQERNRGAALHRLVCKQLGYTDFYDDGRFPDIRHQLLEVKLQTSPTIDLGLICPDSTEPLELPLILGKKIRHCDIRYAIFYAKTDGKEVNITNFFLTTGEIFFKRFPQFQGKIINKKLQIPLPSNFFEF